MSVNAHHAYRHSGDGTDCDVCIRPATDLVHTNRREFLPPEANHAHLYLPGPQGECTFQGCERPASNPLHTVVRSADQRMVRQLTEEQPPPDGGEGDLWDEVIERIETVLLPAMQQRHDHGVEKYGQPVRRFNGRDALIDLFQELLDALVYTQQEISERERYHQLMRSDHGSDACVEMLRSVLAIAISQNGIGISPGGLSDGINAHSWVLVKREHLL